MFYFHFVDGAEKPNVSDLHVFFGKGKQGEAVEMLGTSTHVEHVILYGGDSNFLRSKKKNKKKETGECICLLCREVYLV